MSQSIDQWRVEKRMSAELKWSKIKKQKYGEYSSFIACSAASLKLGRCAFAALVADRHGLDHRSYNGSDQETGFRKLFYQIILHRLVPRMPPGDRLIVYPDKKHDDSSYDELRSALNGGIYKKYGCQRNRIVDAQGICSKKYNLSQVNDLFLGAVGCHANLKYGTVQTSPVRELLAQEIAERVGLASLCKDTPFTKTDFQIWRFKLLPRIIKGRHET